MATPPPSGSTQGGDMKGVPQLGSQGWRRLGLPLSCRRSSLF